MQNMASTSSIIICIALVTVMVSGDKPWLTLVSNMSEAATLRCLVVEVEGGATAVESFWWRSPASQILLGTGTIEGTHTTFLLNNTGHLELSNIQESALGWYTCVADLYGNGTVAISKAWLVKVKTDDEVSEELRVKLTTGGIAGGTLLGVSLLACLVYKCRWKRDTNMTSNDEDKKLDDGRGEINNRLSTSTLEMVVSHDYQTDTVKSSSAGDGGRERGSGGRDSGSGGRESGSGGRESGSGGRESGSGGRDSGSGGRESGIKGRESGSGGRDSSIKGRESGNGGKASGIKGRESGNGGRDSGSGGRDSGSGGRYYKNDQGRIRRRYSEVDTYGREETNGGFEDTEKGEESDTRYVTRIESNGESSNKTPDAAGEQHVMTQL